MERPTTGLCVDAMIVGAADGYGLVSYRGIDLALGLFVFSLGPFPGMTVNVGEYCAIVEGLIYLHTHEDYQTTLYSDSKVALDWVRCKNARPKEPYRLSNMAVFNLKELKNWLSDEPVHQLCWWNGREWGENPADYGRK